MKNAVGRSLVLLASLAILLASCATAPSSGGPAAAASSGGDYAYRGAGSNPSALAKGAIMSATKKTSGPVAIEATSWSKVRIFSDLLDAFKGHETLSLDQKKDLVSYIFDGLPLNASDGVVRQVFIGRYFQDGSPLEIRIGVFTPKGEAALRNEKVIILMTNVVMVADKDGAPAPSLKSGQIVNMDVNALVYCGLKKGLLTNGEKITPDKGWDYAKAEASGSIQKIMAAQAYLADEDLSNDARAEKLVATVLENAEEMPALRIMAMLVHYDYLLSIEDLAGAQKAWGEILALAPSVSGDMTAENLEAMNGESIQLMRYLAAKGK